jgi:oligoendopeptidase F
MLARVFPILGKTKKMQKTEDRNTNAWPPFHIENFEPALASPEKAASRLHDWLKKSAEFEKSTSVQSLENHLIAAYEDIDSLLDLLSSLHLFKSSLQCLEFYAATDTLATQCRARFAQIHYEWKKALFCESEETSDIPNAGNAKDSKFDFNTSLKTTLQKEMPHEVPSQMAALFQVGLSTGFETNGRQIQNILDDQKGFLQEKLITFSNLNSFLTAAKKDLRAQAHHWCEQTLEANATKIFPLRQARMRWVMEAQNSIPGSHFHAARRARQSFSIQTEKELFGMQTRAASFSNKATQWKAAQLGHAFALADRKAPAGTAEKISWPEAWSLIKEVAQELFPPYGNILSELESSGTVLTDPGKIQGQAWFMFTGHRGQSPLVHSPFWGDTESVQALAHELGHACHITHLRRTHGVLTAAKIPMTCAETIALLFEFAVSWKMRSRASHPSQRQNSTLALIDQAQHFLRSMLLRARFDQFRFENPDASLKDCHEKYAQLTFESYGGYFSSPLETQTFEWLRDVFAETMPFYGLEYTLAYLCANGLLFSCSSEQRERFLTWHGQGDFDVAYEQFTHLKLKDQTFFNSIFDKMESLL